MIAGGVASLEYHANGRRKKKEKKKEVSTVALRTRVGEGSRYRAIRSRRARNQFHSFSPWLSRSASSFFLFSFFTFTSPPCGRLGSSTVKEARSDERDVTRKIEESSRRAFKTLRTLPTLLLAPLRADLQRRVYRRIRGRRILVLNASVRSPVYIRCVHVYFNFRSPPLQLAPGFSAAFK